MKAGIWGVDGFPSSAQGAAPTGKGMPASVRKSGEFKQLGQEFKQFKRAPAKRHAGWNVDQKVLFGEQATQAYQ